MLRSLLTGSGPLWHHPVEVLPAVILARSSIKLSEPVMPFRQRLLDLSLNHSTIESPSRRLSNGASEGPRARAFGGPQQTISQPGHVHLQLGLGASHRRSCLKYVPSPQQISNLQPDQLQSNIIIPVLSEAQPAAANPPDDERRASHAQAGSSQAVSSSSESIQHDHSAEQHPTVSSLRPIATLTAHAPHQSLASVDAAPPDSHSIEIAQEDIRASSSKGASLQPDVCIVDGSVQKVVYRSVDGFCILKVKVISVSH